MHRILTTAFTLVLLSSLVAPAAEAWPPAGSHGPPQSHDRRLVVRFGSGDPEQVAARHGLSVVRSFERPGTRLALIEGPDSMSSEQIADLLTGEPEVERTEQAIVASLPGFDGFAPPGPTYGMAGALAPAGTASTPCSAQAFQAELWSGFAEQEAAELIRLQQAHAVSSDCGAATVAVIDTGVDPDHPLLADALVPGYDFLQDVDGEASEWTQLRQSVSPIVEQQLLEVVEPSLEATLAGHGELFHDGPCVAPIIEPAMADNLDAEDLPDFFGHGTMVAGLVRLVAPEVRIMPLRVFDGDGKASLYDVVRAIYHAVDHGADVINMSFSLEIDSEELSQALGHARDAGVACVAAAGNRGDRTLVYPAAHAEVVGIASTELDDTLSDFSSHGSELVTLAAPGSGLISSYPGGLYAAGWGTSFSAPLVAGTVALLRQHYSSTSGWSVYKKVRALEEGSVELPALSGDVGSGRLDARGALDAADDDCGWGYPGHGHH